MSLPGWYPDPRAQAPLRWWDGATWTPDVHAAPALATWGQRVRAYLVDAVGLWIFSWIVLSPFHRTLTDELTGILTSSVMTTGGSFPSLGTLWDYGLLSVWLTAAVPGVLVRIAHDVWFTTRRGGSLGHTNAGLRVVEAHRPGKIDGISLQAAFVRSVVVRALAPTCIGWLLVVLWPLWDPERRSLADIAARTRVVQDPASHWTW